MPENSFDLRVEESVEDAHHDVHSEYGPSLAAGSVALGVSPCSTANDH